MNLFAVISLVSFVVCFCCGAVVYIKDRKALTNRLYTAAIMALAAFSMLQFGYRSSHTYEEAVFWWRLDFFWPILTPLVLHFTLVITQREHIAKQKWVLAFLYVPAIVIGALDGTLHLFTGPPVRQYWGWNFSIPHSWVAVLAYVWQQVFLIVSFVLAFRYMRSAADQKKRAQVKLICIGMGIALVATIMELSCIYFGFAAPPIAMMGLVAAHCFIGYTIGEYEVFALSPITAAEHIVSTMPDSLLLVSPAGKILSANRAASEMLGFTQQELLGRPVEEIFSDKAPRLGWLDDDVENRRISAFEQVDNLDTIFRTKNDDNISVSLAACSLKDDNGKPLGFVIIGRDVSEQKEAFEQLRKYRNHLEGLVDKGGRALRTETFERIKVERARDHLEEQLFQSQKMEAVGRLAGGVAHDFNNLLFVISGCTGLISESIDDTDPIKIEVDEIGLATKRAADLVEQLLAFSRKQIVNPQKIHLYKILGSLERMLGRMIGEDISLISNVAGDLAPLRMDPVQLEQVLTNLFINARDAMPRGGKVEISAKNIFLDEEFNRYNPETESGWYICMSVRDTGCGMDEDVKGRIFEPFFSTKDKSKGTGLGLSTVYGIIRQNHGFVNVFSQVDQGTTFDIYLPVAKGDDVTDLPTEKEIGPGGKETILVVEDDAMVRRLATIFLKRQGYVVLEANSGPKAIDVFEKQAGKIDLLFTDIVMPGMSGKQLAKKLRAENAGLRVLYMSGYNDEIIDRHGCLSTDIPLLQKPFSQNDLSWKVREVLGD